MGADAYGMDGGIACIRDFIGISTFFTRVPGGLTFITASIMVWLYCHGTLLPQEEFMKTMY